MTKPSFMFNWINMQVFRFLLIFLFCKFIKELEVHQCMPVIYSVKG